MDPLQPLLKRCLALTGAFETSKPSPACFSGLAGDFDGMGLSFGALQWNLGQKTLQPMLQQMLAGHEGVLTGAFGALMNQLKYMLAVPRAAQLEWALSIQDKTHHTINEPWAGCFAALGQTAEFQAIQMVHAESIYQEALERCRKFALVTERGVALMFDIRVQNGAISNPVELKIRADFAAIALFTDPKDAEVIRLRSIAKHRAEAANPMFVDDVKNRKLTIANGAGTVHGATYNLESHFGIRLEPIPA